MGNLARVELREECQPSASSNLSRNANAVEFALRGRESSANATIGTGLFLKKLSNAAAAEKIVNGL